MKRILAIVFLLLCGRISFAQDSLWLPDITRSTRSYLIVDSTENDTAFLKENCRQAGLDIGLSVLANRVKTNSRYVGPMPSRHLLAQGTLQLQQSIDANQTEMAVYRSELFDTPATINVLLIDNELITYRSTEPAGNIHLLYNCTRGAFGTKKAAHSHNAIVYKLWDTPERTLLPDLELQDQMVLAEAIRLSKTDYPILIFNDLKSYAYNEQGDTAIAHLLDTMHKYNPDKLLQADLLTPASWQYLSRVNENQFWNASMRVKIVETLTDMQTFYRDHQMPWMIGNFNIHLADRMKPATTMEELEWFLSKAAAFDAGFGLEFDEETMRRHGLTDEMLSIINIWETLRLSNAFSEKQKEAFKDPYENWHISLFEDSICFLESQYISRRYYCNLDNNTWEWDNPYDSRFALQIAVEGQGNISEMYFNTPNGELHLPFTVKAGQYLFYDFHFTGTIIITDSNYNTIEVVYLPEDILNISKLHEGANTVSFSCSYKGKGGKCPEVSIRFITRSDAEPIRIPSGLLRSSQ